MKIRTTHEEILSVAEVYNRFQGLYGWTPFRYGRTLLVFFCPDVGL